MLEEVLKAITIYFWCMLKFVFGPAGGYAVGLHPITTILTTVSGMMTVVFLFTFFDKWIRAKIFSRFKSKKPNAKSGEKFQMIWKRYGLVGVAILTPIVLTPIGGTLLAVSSGSPKDKIIFYMFVSASFWAVVISMAFYILGNEVLPDFLKPTRNL